MDYKQKPRYGQKDLQTLFELLSKVVGQDVAKEWVDKRVANNTSYGLPASKDGKYTPYGYVRNLDTRPGRYYDTNYQHVKVTDDKDWKDNFAAGTFSLLGGINIPRGDVKNRRIAPEEALVHEYGHKFDYEDALRKNNKYATGLSDLYRNFLSRDFQKGTRADLALTGQDASSEITPQLRHYESRLPAGMNLQQSDLWKNIPDKYKAELIRRMNPIRYDLDAMVGGGEIGAN